jgi:hypothetical protein
VAGGRFSSSRRNHDNLYHKVQQGIRHLRSMRDGKGGWRTFPFWYTMLALSEIELPGAGAEIRYASAGLDRVVGRSSATRFGCRRQAIAERALTNS